MNSRMPMRIFRFAMQPKLICGSGLPPCINAPSPATSQFTATSQMGTQIYECQTMLHGTTLIYECQSVFSGTGAPNPSMRERVSVCLGRRKLTRYIEMKTRNAVLYSPVGALHLDAWASSVASHLYGGLSGQRRAPTYTKNLGKA